MKRIMSFLQLLASCTACHPALNDEARIISTPTLLAVKAEPPEAKPASEVTFSALVANPQSGSSTATPIWRFCSAPKALTENNSVSAACLDDAALVSAGTGSTIDTKLPAASCSAFGPEGLRGGNRPHDPDDTGGFYQPLRVDVQGNPPAFHRSRILCPLASASADVALEFAQTYTANRNPHLWPLEATVGDVSLSLDLIPAGVTLQLRSAWAEQDAETYAYFDPGAQTVVMRREAMQVAWYVSAGRLLTSVATRGEYDLQTSVTTDWVAPAEPGPVHVWQVLRDSRGGTDYSEHLVIVVR